MHRCLMFALAVSLAMFAGCEEKPVPTVEPLPAVDATEPTRAQPKLQTIKLWVGAEELITELALNATQTRTGMMFRTNIADNEAMLFVSSIPHATSFWMKNVPIPLSAAYIDPEGAILELHEFKPHDTNAVVSASSRIQYVLETSQGWFDRHNVRTGMVIRTERGTLRETFFKR